MDQMEDSLFDLKSKNIAITGGTSYLGIAMSDALAKYGANLFILGHNREKSERFSKELKAKYGRTLCEGIACDVSDKLSIQAAVDMMIGMTGKIDVLINNAAYYGDGTPFEHCLDENWLKSIDGTINSTRNVTQIVIRQMLRQQSGNVINIASMYGVVAPDMGIYADSRENNPASYGAGKAAVIQLTKYLASVYACEGIRANVISPGAFPNQDVQKNTEFIHNLERKNPMGRIGRPDDLKGIVVFLASDASSYINGQNIMVDGGWTAW